MSVVLKSGFCAQCNQQRAVKAEWGKAGCMSFILLIALVTFGVGLLLLPLVLLVKNEYRCTTCGSKKISRVE